MAARLSRTAPTSTPGARARSLAGSMWVRTCNRSAACGVEDDPDVDELLAVHARDDPQHDVLVADHVRLPGTQASGRDRRARSRSRYAVRTAPGSGRCRSSSRSSGTAEHLGEGRLASRRRRPGSCTARGVQPLITAARAWSPRTVYLDEAARVGGAGRPGIIDIRARAMVESPGARYRPSMVGVHGSGRRSSDASGRDATGGRVGQQRVPTVDAEADRAGSGSPVQPDPRRRAGPAPPSASAFKYRADLNIKNDEDHSGTGNRAAPAARRR